MNYVKHPWLIQRCVIEQGRADDMRFSTSARTEYMGSAEYEFGALPSSLMELHENKQDIILTEIVSVFGRPLHILHTFDMLEFRKYIEYLKNIAKGKHHLKENSEFAFYDKWIANKEKRKFMKADLWWDIDNHAFFSYDKKYMNELVSYLENSWNYMEL